MSMIFLSARSDGALRSLIGKTAEILSHQMDELLRRDDGNAGVAPEREQIIVPADDVLR
jgi:hypothetical protein